MTDTAQLKGRFGELHSTVKGEVCGLAVAYPLVRGQRQLRPPSPHMESDWSLRREALPEPDVKGHLKRRRCLICCGDEWLSLPGLL